MSLQPAPISLGLADGPPVSPAHEEGEATGVHSAATAPTQPPRPPLEAELVQQGKLSMGQLAQAHRDRLEKGGSVLDIIVERGWVTAGDVEALRARHAADEAARAAAPKPPPRIPETTTAPDPKPEPAQATSVEAEVVAHAPEPTTAQDTGTTDRRRPAAYQICIRLTTGELVPAGEAADGDAAEKLAQVLVADVATADEAWPYVSGRYIRPETIVSIDIIPAS
jgi:hypothetical protein